MQKKFTFKKKGFLAAMLCTSMMAAVITPASAQTFCANETVFFSENFGTGTGSVSSPDVINVQHAPVAPESYLEDGFYRIIDNTQQRLDWHNAPDHTPGDANGRALVINGSAEQFYSKILTNGVNGFSPASYATSLYLMNVHMAQSEVCGSFPLLPSITFAIEYSTTASGNNWVLLQSVTSNEIPRTSTPVWNQLGSVFNLPVPAQRIRITLSDAINSGCGNDFAVDDILFASCPDGGPLPVQFANLSAVVRGSGVSVDWSTASEHNNQYFEIERSTDGTTWNSFTRTNAKGNSTALTKYNAYDAKPNAGNNYYRIKQVDIDGKFNYSPTARVNISIKKTGVSVLANPFVNNITVDFLSNENQYISVKLTDLSGKLIATDRWKVNKGNTRATMNQVLSLQRGMYILTVTDSNNEVIYNNKLIKQ